jgi:hypothetical protein
MYIGVRELTSPLNDVEAIVTSLGSYNKCVAIVCRDRLAGGNS